jgi:hypothetical protein
LIDLGFAMCLAVSQSRAAMHLKRRNHLSLGAMRLKKCTHEFASASVSCLTVPSEKSAEAIVVSAGSNLLG